MTVCEQEQRSEAFSALKANPTMGLHLLSPTTLHIVEQGLGTDDFKLDQILSLLTTKPNPNPSPISNVGSAEADSILLDLGFLQEHGNKAHLL
ncbi:hypothetical protein WJX82_002261 [Trebouxia sp. C0006]